MHISHSDGSPRAERKTHAEAALRNAKRVDSPSSLDHC